MILLRPCICGAFFVSMYGIDMFLFSFVYEDDIVKKKDYMMRLFILLALFFIIPFSFAHAASANRDNGNDTQEKIELTESEMRRWAGLSLDYTKHYQDLVEDMRAGRKDIKQSMLRLRNFYSFTPHYDPFSKAVIDEMVGYAYIADTSEDRIAVNQALTNYRELLSRHLANLDVVSYALMLSRLDVRYGDEYFLKEVRDAIRTLWDGQGSVGEKPQHPYKVVTFAELQYVVDSYGGEVVNSDVYTVGRQFFDVRDIVTDDGDYVQVFFDITRPIRNVALKKAVREKEQKTIIPLQ